MLHRYLRKMQNSPFTILQNIQNPVIRYVLNDQVCMVKLSKIILEMLSHVKRGFVIKII